MVKKTYILTESQIKRVVDEILKEQSEKIYTDFDRIYDYKLSGNMWYGSRKGSNKWFSLSKYPEAIRKLNARYNPKPVAQAAQNVVKKVDNASDVAARKVKSTASSFPEKFRTTRGAIGDTLRNTRDVVGDTLRNTRDVVGDKVRATGDVISDKAKEGVGDIKGFMRKMSPNVAQMFFTRPLTGDDFSKPQKRVIYNVIQNAIKRGKGKTRGVTDYSDYGGKIKSTFDTRTGARTRDIILKSATSPSFQVASTLGAFSYQLQRDGSYLVTDTYDFSKGIGYTVKKEEIEGMPYMKQLSYVMKKDNLTPYRAARQIAYIEHPETADEGDKVKIRLTVDPKEFSA